MSSSSAAAPLATRRPCEAAWPGLNIAVVEKEKVGGTCLHRGCIPAKEFLETATVYRTVAGAKEFGIAVDPPSIEFAQSQARKQKVVDQLWRGLQGLMKRRKITTFIGTGTLGPDHVVRVDDDTELVGKHVILASGSVPRSIPGFEVDGDLVLTSDEVLDLEHLPASAVVIGGGAIGCEFASMLADLGTQVTVLEALPKILPGCDKDVADVVLRSFKKRGIEVRTGVTVTGHTPSPDGSSTTVEFGDGEGGHRGRGGGVGRPAAAVGQPGPGGHQGPGRPPRLRGGRRVHANRRAGGFRGRRSGRHPGPGPCRLRRGGRYHRPDPGRDGGAGGLHEGAVVHLLPARGGLRRAVRGGGPWTPASRW